MEPTSAASPSRTARGPSPGLVALLVFVLLTVVYSANCSPLLGNDTRPVRYAAVSLVKRGDLDLNEFAPAIRQGRPGWPYWVTVTSAGRIYSRFGFGTVLAAAPLFAAALHGRGGKLPEGEALLLAKLVRSLHVAATAALLYLLAYALLGHLAPGLGSARGSSSTRHLLALAVGGIYGLAGCAFSTVSQALWQHGPAELWLTVALALLFLATAPPGAVRELWPPLSRLRPGLAAGGAGGALAAMVTCRPPLALFALAGVAVAGLADARARRLHLLPLLLLGAAPLAIAQALYNLELTGSPLVFSQMLQVEGPDRLPHAHYWRPSVLTGLAGLLVAPSRGLLVYSPVYLLLLVRPRARWRGAGLVGKSSLVASALYLLVQSSYYGWYGGATFGYRMLVDLTPLLALALLPVLLLLPGPRRGLAAPDGRPARPSPGRASLRVLFAVLLGISVAIHTAGALCYSPEGWDFRVRVDDHPERLWSLTDSQLGQLFGDLRLRPRVLLLPPPGS